MAQDDYSNISCEWCLKSMIYKERRERTVNNDTLTLCPFCTWILDNMEGIENFNDIEEVYGWLVMYYYWKGLWNEFGIT